MAGRVSGRLAPADMPGTLPIFPLQGVLLLPRGKLPLNIFEPRYLAMVEDALATRDKLIGMIQPLAKETRASAQPVYPIGCAGRIVSWSETDDGRFLIGQDVRFDFVDPKFPGNGMCRRRVVSREHDDLHAGLFQCLYRI